MQIAIGALAAFTVSPQEAGSPWNEYPYRPFMGHVTDRDLASP